MSRIERRLLFSALTLLVLTLSLCVGFGQQIPTAHADPPLIYYGADTITGMKLATGVSTSNSYPSAPWPQAAGNYCFLADVQAIVRYSYWNAGYNISGAYWPARSNQGPPTYSAAKGNPQLEVSGQLLYDMDNYEVANFSPGPTYVLRAKPLPLDVPSHWQIPPMILEATHVPLHMPFGTRQQAHVSITTISIMMVFR